MTTGKEMKIPELVKTLRTRANMTQRELEEAASLPGQLIGNVERGQSYLKAHYLLRIIEVTGHEMVIRRKESES